MLVTHGPPYGLGDRTFLGMRVGCGELLARVRHVAPKLHVFGHIHEAYGEYADPHGTTRYLNVASRPLLPFGVRPPTVIEL